MELPPVQSVDFSLTWWQQHFTDSATSLVGNCSGAIHVEVELSTGGIPAGAHLVSSYAHLGWSIDNVVGTHDWGNHSDATDCAAALGCSGIF